MLGPIFKKIEDKIDLSIEEIEQLLSIQKKDALEKLYQTAYKIKTSHVGKTVWFRGLIEISNICGKDCYYCGIRKSNHETKRFLIPKDEIIKSALWAYNANYGSIVLQSGERSDHEFIEMVADIVKTIKEESNNKLGITLSLGEQDKGTYKKWFDAGAHRYLLRIETSNPKLYEKLHPKDHIFQKRLDCLKSLHDLGYQVGTGVMIGLPFQTMTDLANDILFFKEMNVDMIGMGPFIYHQNTPLIQYQKDHNLSNEELLTLGLKMIAVTRIVLKDINIASTTALQALDDKGREMGLLAGANVIMPNVTDPKYKENYLLYENKPCTDENASMCKDCLKRRIEAIGETTGYSTWGDSPHFFKSDRNKKK